MTDRALELAIKILALQQQAVPPGWRAFQKLLGPEQKALRNDQAPLVAADPGRRAGKTTTFLAKSLKVLKHGGPAGVAYFAPSDDQGESIIWEDIQIYNRDYELGLRERWSDREWAYGTSKIEIIGFNERKDAERARGRKFRLAWIDEAQLAPSWFTKMVESAIMPTTLDYLGQVYATGTPGEVADGFFFDACHSSAWSNNHHWTAQQNPFFIRQGRDPLAEARKRYGLDENSITYKREWLGLWLVDPDELVYYIPDAAIVDTKWDAWYGNVIGLDLGWRDHDAIAVEGVCQSREWSRLRHMETTGQQTNHQLFRRIMELGEKFPGPQGAPVVVYDPAGHATKKTIETFRVDAPKIHWVQADKPQKVQHIEWLNNDLREGKTFVEAGNLMIKEAKRLRWKRPGKLAEDAQHSDPGDAWLYSWRYARDLLRILAPVKEEAPSDPFQEHLARMRAAEKQQGRGGYFASRAKTLG